MNVHPKSASAPSSDPRSGTPRQPAGHEEPARRDPPGPGRDRPDHDDGKRSPHPDRQSPPRKDDPPRTPDGGRERKAVRHAAAGIGAALALALFAFLPTAPSFAADAQNADETDSAHPVTDTWITGKVKAELATTDGVHSLDIGVTTVNGVVTLTGVQPTDLAVKKAIAAAKSVKGVKAVDAAGLKTK